MERNNRELYIEQLENLRLTGFFRGYPEENWDFEDMDNETLEYEFRKWFQPDLKRE